jgi:hypothetical protein
MTTAERSSVTPSGDGRFRSVLPTLAVAATMVLLGARFFGVIQKYSVNIFYSDQWDYLSLFFRGQAGIVNIFLRQHGPHREGLGLFPDKLLFPFTHWNSRVDSFVIGGIIFLAMLAAIRLKCKLFGPVSYSDVAIPVIFLSLEQFETLLDVPNPAPYAFPLLLIMLYCLAWVSERQWMRYSLVLVVNFLLIYTGYGIVMGVITVAVFLLVCYWSWRGINSTPLAHATLGLAVSTLSFGSFFIHYRILPNVGCFESGRPPFFRYPEFMALMFGASVVSNHQHFSAMLVVGGLILLSAIIIGVSHLFQLLGPARSDADLIGVVLLAFCLLFSLSAAMGRLCLGPQEAYQSRHHTLLITGFLAIYFFLLSRRWRGKKFVLAVLILLLLPATLLKPTIVIQQLAAHKREWAACYVQTHSFRFCDENVLVLYPSPERNQMQQKLDYLEQHRLNFFYDYGSK